MKVNFVDLQRQTKILKEELLKEIEGVLDRADFIQGKAVEEFENNFAKFCNKKYCVALNSGTDALEFALRAYEIKDGEVITAPNSYFSSAMVIAKVGARPVFVDVDEESFNIDVTKLEKAITKNTKAIIPIHLCGQSADLDPIYSLAKKHNLKVIEDCCQSHGAEYKGKRVPIGETGCFSFYPGKNLGSFGDGGALVTDNEEIANYVRLLRNDGSKIKYYHEIIGHKSRLDTIQAVILNLKLKHLEKWNSLRREHAKKYGELLKDIISTPKEMPYAKHVYHLYVIKSKKRDELQKFLAEKGISTVIHYPIPIHLQKAFEYLEHKKGNFPVTEKLADEIVSIPMFPELTEEEMKHVVSGIKEFEKKKCDLCFKDSTVELLNLGKQPLANKYPTKEQFNTEDFFPLNVYFCNDCNNVQLGTMVSRARMFEDYYYLSSVNQGLVRHFEEFAKQLKDAKFVLDIGSNDGILLKPLKEMGIKAVGVEPSINVSKIANDAGLTTITSFFNEEAVQQVEKKYGKPDVIVASSIFTHLDNPHQFITDVKKIMPNEGVFIIEVEYIGNIIRDIQFERFYLDRIFYYSLNSLKDLFTLHGMVVSDVEHVEPHGGSLRVYVHKKESGKVPTERIDNVLNDEKKQFSKLDNFKDKVNEYISAFRQKLVEYKKAGLRVAGYGAPARVTTICNLGNIGPELIEYIIDDSALKQNKFSPGTHIPIYPREHLDKNKPDILVVFAFEYFEDIKKKTAEGNYRYLIPIPPREVN